MAKLDVRDLPVGTKFRVLNGDWYGEIIEEDNVKYIKHLHGKTKIRAEDMELIIEKEEVEL
jgi:hypothetical protein